MPSYRTENPIRGQVSALDPFGLLRAQELRRVVGHPVLPQPIQPLEWEAQLNVVIPRRDEDYRTVCEWGGRDVSISWNVREGAPHGSARVTQPVFLPVAHSHRVNGLDVRMVRRYDDSGYRLRVRHEGSLVSIATRWGSFGGIPHLIFDNTHHSFRVMSAVTGSITYSFETMTAYARHHEKCVACACRVTAPQWLCVSCEGRVRRHAPTRTGRQVVGGNNAFNWGRWAHNGTNCFCFSCYGA